MHSIKNYIIIDDDFFYITISSIALKRALGDVKIKSFTEPEAGLEYFQNEYNRNLKPAVLLLDINMPTLTGWEFMEEYERFSEEVKKNITVYIVSSSIDQYDKDKAKANKYIRGFISKPLDQETILSIAGMLQHHN